MLAKHLLIWISRSPFKDTNRGLFLSNLVPFGLVVLLWKI